MSLGSGIKIEHAPCIKLGWKGRERLVPIRTIVENDKVCVPLNASDPWLNIVVGDRCRGHTERLLRRFISEIKSKLKKSGNDCQIDEVGEQSSTQHSSSTSSEVGSALGRSKSDITSCDENAESTQSSNRPLQFPGRFITVRVRGVELTAKRRGGRGDNVIVPLGGDSLINVCRFLRERNKLGDIPPPDFDKALRREEALRNREEKDAGRIRWSMERSAYVVTYMNANGKRSQTVRGLHVSFDDNNDELVRQRKLKKARLLWNTFDKSDAERYKL